MNLINRGFIFIKPKAAFVTWALSLDPNLLIDTHAEGSVYLIEEEFWDDELILNQYAKKIAQQEFMSINDDASTWPSCNEATEFENLFTYELGCTCVDLLKIPLEKELL
jgi:hypothetical protein